MVLEFGLTINHRRSWIHHSVIALGNMDVIRMVSVIVTIGFKGMHLADRKPENECTDNEEAVVHTWANHHLVPRGDGTGRVVG